MAGPQPAGCLGACRPPIRHQARPRQSAALRSLRRTGRRGSPPGLRPPDAGAVVVPQAPPARAQEAEGGCPGMTTMTFELHGSDVCRYGETEAKGSAPIHKLARVLVDRGEDRDRARRGGPGHHGLLQAGAARVVGRLDGRREGPGRAQVRALPTRTKWKARQLAGRGAESAFHAPPATHLSAGANARLRRGRVVKPVFEHCILGVDPGLSVAVAFYFPTRQELIGVDDMPLAAGEIDAAALARRIEQMGPTMAVVEQVGAMPKQGVASTFRFGAAYGAVCGILQA